MRNINDTNCAEAKVRFLSLVLTLSMLTVSVTGAGQSMAVASGAMVRTVQDWGRESRAILRYSVRMYRFYKLSSGAPMAKASSCN